MIKDTPKEIIDVRRNKNQTLDEIVSVNCFVHLEQMDKNSWWLGIMKNNYRQVVNFSLNNDKLNVISEMDFTPSDYNDDISTLELKTKNLKNILEKTQEELNSVYRDLTELKSKNFIKKPGYYCGMQDSHDTGFDENKTVTFSNTHWDDYLKKNTINLNNNIPNFDVPLPFISRDSNI